MTEPPRYVFVRGISRSGTTLLTTILDASPAISMGYELNTGGLPAAGALRGLIEDALGEAGDRPRRVGNLIRKRGHGPAGAFVKRAARALVPPAELAAILQRLDREGHDDLTQVPAQAELIRGVIDAKMTVEHTSIGGSKIGLDAVGTLLGNRTDAAVITIVRDPRDVVASCNERGMTDGAAAICRSWNALLAGAGTMVVRYEDLVQTPRPTIERLCADVRLPFDEAMLAFSTSKASVLQPQQRHANDEALRRGFFTTSIGRWRDDLDTSAVRRIERACGRGMTRLGYERTTQSRLRGLVGRVTEA